MTSSCLVRSVRWPKARWHRESVEKGGNHLVEGPRVMWRGCRLGMAHVNPVDTGKARDRGGSSDIGGDG